MPPAVEPPADDQARLERDVVARYHRTLASFAPEAHALALGQPPVEELDDETFVATLTGTLFAGALCETLDPPDRARFGATHCDRATHKIDLSPLGEVAPIPGVSLSPTVTLLERLGGDWRFQPVAIALGEDVLEPGSPRWPLARLFVLQGLTQATVTGFHARLHFPMDVFIAVTRRVLDAAHPVRRVVEGHAPYALALDHRVLEHPRSILRNDPADPYACFALDEQGCRHLIHLAYAGVPGNSAWPAWRWPRGPRRSGAPFHLTECAYYGVIRRFTEGIVATMAWPDPQVSCWADHLGAWLPGFPGPETIRSRLADVLAYFVADVSVMHSAEHEDLAAIPVGRRPFRLRLPFDRTPQPSELRHAVDRLDVVRTCFADEMYFRPTPVTLLRHVDYAFDDPRQRVLRDELVAALVEVDAQLGDRAAIALDRIAAGIQF